MTIEKPMTVEILQKIINACAGKGPSDILLGTNHASIGDVAKQLLAALQRISELEAGGREAQGDDCREAFEAWYVTQPDRQTPNWNGVEYDNKYCQYRWQGFQAAWQNNHPSSSGREGQELAAVNEARKALRCLHIAVENTVAADVQQKVERAFDALIAAAAPKPSTTHDAKVLALAVLGIIPDCNTQSAEDVCKTELEILQAAKRHNPYAATHDHIGDVLGANRQWHCLDCGSKGKWKWFMDDDNRGNDSVPVGNCPHCPTTKRKTIKVELLPDDTEARLRALAKTQGDQ